jgi:hypothetical protein
MRPTASWWRIPSGANTPTASTPAGGGGGLHRLPALRRVCPAKNKTAVGRKAINMEGSTAAARARRQDNWDFFLQLPETQHVDTLKLDQRQERAVAAAALRVLRRLRRLRRDALSQADQPALRRPLCDRQRHRLLSIYGGNLPTTPWAQEPGRPRPGLVQLALRGQRRVRLGMRVTLDKQVEYAANCSTGCRRDRRRPGRRAADRRPERRSGIAAQRQRVEQLQQLLAASTSPEARDLLSWPTSWSRKMSGSSAATAGPTTSATAAWTTCWPAGATSTCWCWTPRSTPTPAARRPSRRRWARWPSSPPAASDPRRTWARWP